MQTVLVELLALVIGASVVPLGVVITLVLLRGSAGRIRAIGFTAGGMAVQLAQGLVFGYLLRGAAANAAGRGGIWFAPILLLLAGVALLCTLALALRGNSDFAANPKWLTMLGEMSALSAFGIGALLMVIAVNQWAFILSAVGLIGEAKLGWTRSVIAYLCFVIAANWLLLTPVIISAIAPVRARWLLDTAHRWMERNNRGITVVFSLAFGLWFLWKGIAGLMPDRNPPIVSMILAFGLGHPEAGPQLASVIATASSAPGP